MFMTVRNPIDPGAMMSPFTLLSQTLKGMCHFFISLLVITYKSAEDN